MCHAKAAVTRLRSGAYRIRLSYAYCLGRVRLDRRFANPDNAATSAARIGHSTYSISIGKVRLWLLCVFRQWASRMEHARQSRRFAVQLPSVHGTGAEKNEGTVLNLSRHGCAMTAEQIPAVADYISLQVDFLDGKEPLTVELAAVRWVSGPRCGLEFIRISPEMTLRLKAFVELLEGTP